MVKVIKINVFQIHPYEVTTKWLFLNHLSLTTKWKKVLFFNPFFIQFHHKIQPDQFPCPLPSCSRTDFCRTQFLSCQQSSLYVYLTFIITSIATHSRRHCMLAQKVVRVGGHRSNAFPGSTLTFYIYLVENDDKGLRLS